VIEKEKVRARKREARERKNIDKLAHADPYYVKNQTVQKIKNLRLLVSKENSFLFHPPQF
jgi:hypothetical protein